MVLNIIENIGIALLISGAVVFLAYFIVASMKKQTMSVVQIVCLAILFLFSTFQMYKFLDAWDEKSAIVELIDGGKNWANDALDFLDEVDRRNGGKGEVVQQINDALKDPLVQKGLRLFGIDTRLSSDGMSLQMLEDLRSEYNWYMFRRVCWILGGMVLCAIVCMVAGGSSGSGHNTPRREYARREPRHSSQRNKRY